MKLLFTTMIVAAAAVCGYLAIWLPWVLAGSHKNMIDGMRMESLIYLMLVGLVGGLARPQSFWIVGLASMMAFPFVAIAESMQDPSTHNLLGLEIAMYGLLTLPALLGGGIGKGIRAWLDRPDQTKP